MLLQKPLSKQNLSSISDENKNSISEKSETLSQNFVDINHPFDFIQSFSSQQKVPNMLVRLVITIPLC